MLLLGRRRNAMAPLPKLMTIWNIVSVPSVTGPIPAVHPDRKNPDNNVRGMVGSK